MTTSKTRDELNREDIYGISVIIERDIGDYLYIVSVLNTFNGKTIVRLEYEYEDRSNAYGEYNMLRTLLKDVAAIYLLPNKD
jgi:hypothetical protein